MKREHIVFVVLLVVISLLFVGIVAIGDVSAQDDWRDLTIDASDIAIKDASRVISLSDDTSLVILGHDDKGTWLQLWGQTPQQYFFDRSALQRITITKMTKTITTAQGEVHNFKVTIYRRGDLLRGINEMQFRNLTISQLGNFARELARNLLGFLEARDIHCNVSIGKTASSLSCGHQL